MFIIEWQGHNKENIENKLLDEVLKVYNFQLLPWEQRMKMLVGMPVAKTC